MKSLVYIILVILFLIGVAGLFFAIKQCPEKKRPFIGDTCILVVFGFLVGRFLFPLPLSLFDEIYDITLSINGILISLSSCILLLWLPKITKKGKFLISIIVECILILTLIYDYHMGGLSSTIPILSLFIVLIYIDSNKKLLSSQLSFFSFSLMIGIINIANVQIGDRTYFLSPNSKNCDEINKNIIVVNRGDKTKYGVISPFGNSIIDAKYSLLYSYEGRYNDGYLAVKGNMDGKEEVGFIFFNSVGDVLGRFWIPSNKFKYYNLYGHERKKKMEDDGNESLESILEDDLKIKLHCLNGSWNNELTRYGADYNEFAVYFWGFDLNETSSSTLEYKEEKVNAKIYEPVQETVQKGQTVPSQPSTNSSSAPYQPEYEMRSVWVNCWACHGNGECDQCHGSGTGITVASHGTAIYKCPSCNGSGRCYICNGTRGHYELQQFRVR